IASASTVAVVVPSPAASEVFEAASFTSLAPMFSYLSLSSISSATVTPSLVTVGAPHPLSMTALRPRGPSVVFTARASFETPDSSALRASISKASILAAMPDLLSEEAVVSCLLLVVVVGNALTHRPTARPRVSPGDEPSAHEAACQTVCPNRLCAQVTMPQGTMSASPNARDCQRGRNRLVSRRAVAIVAGEYALHGRLRFFAIRLIAGSFCLAGTPPPRYSRTPGRPVRAWGSWELSSSLAVHVRLHSCRPRGAYRTSVYGRENVSF